MATVCQGILFPVWKQSRTCVHDTPQLPIFNNQLNIVFHESQYVPPSGDGVTSQASDLSVQANQALVKHPEEAKSCEQAKKDRKQARCSEAHACID